MMPSFRHPARCARHCGPRQRRHRGADEYIGKAYLTVGGEKNAEKHLAALKRICLPGCEEPKDLEEAFRSRGLSPR
jgi:hypothetical protein